YRKRTLFAKRSDVRLLLVSRAGICRRAGCVAIFSRDATLSTNSERIASRNGVRRGRLSGTEPGLVFPIARQRLDDSIEAKERCEIHAKDRTAFHCSTDG